MSTKTIMSLLDKASDNKQLLLEIANSYVADKLNIFYSVENYDFVKDNSRKPFKALPEFEALRNNIQKIENSTEMNDAFFSITEDIEKIIKYLDDEMLVQHVDVEPETRSLKESEKKVNGLDITASERKESVDLSFASASDDVEFANDDAELKMSFDIPGEESKPKEEKNNGNLSQVFNTFDRSPDYDDEDDQGLVVGIYKEATEDKVSWMAGYADTYEDDDIDGDGRSNPFAEDLISEQDRPERPKIFNDENIKTDYDDIREEAEMLINNGSNYIFTGCNPKMYLSKRFEFYRIKYALKSISDGADPEGEFEIIKNELIKIKSYLRHNAIVSVQMIEYDMFLVEKIYGLLKEFDERLYSPEEMPNIDELVSLMDTTSDYDQKATLLHKFFCVDTLNFLKVIYKSCSNIELDKKSVLKLKLKELKESPSMLS